MTLKTLRYYRENVKGNEETSHSQANRKMTRNFILGYRTVRKDGSVHCKYGCLHFIVSKGRVVWIENNRKPHKGWIHDSRLYLELNEELKIKNDNGSVGKMEN